MLESEAFTPGVALNTSRHPDWPPDGSRITYASTRSGSLQIWVMNADGSGQARVTNDPASNNFPRFSPDGSKVVYESGVEIHVINLVGTGEKNLSDGSGPDVMPNWGPSSD